MKDGDAVRINTPGESAHGLIGHIVWTTDSGDYWVFLLEYGVDRKYAAKDLVAVEPQL